MHDDGESKLRLHDLRGSWICWAGKKDNRESDRRLGPITRTTGEWGSTKIEEANLPISKFEQRQSNGGNSNGSCRVTLVHEPSKRFGFVEEMARQKQREYPNAIYHVINRGNYRSDVFGTVGAAEAFVKVLAEATDRFGWKLGAYVVMTNHFHFAVQTSEPNSSVGMQWLSVTFAARSNRLRQETGHFFSAVREGEAVTF